MWKVVLVGLVVAVLMVGAAAAGRVTAPNDEREAGVREGRQLQVPPQARDAFQAGYEAGADDVFGGFDGGWDYDVPYVITLKKGTDGVTYAIATRRKLSG
jgi:hypothetical protein